MRIIEGPCLALFSSNGIRSAWSNSKEFIVQTKPTCIELHTWPGNDMGHVMTEIREVNAGTDLWVGPGIDGIASKLKAGRFSEATAVDEMLKIARGADIRHLSGIVWNGEQAFKTENRADKEKMASFVRLSIDKVAALYPNLSQGHTAYDGPIRFRKWGGHSSYPWKAWIGPGSPIKFSAPQIYWGQIAPKPAVPGDGNRRNALHSGSWASAIASGIISPEVERIPYLQVHGCTPEDLVNVAMQYKGCLLWAAPTRMDANGVKATKALFWLYKNGYWGLAGIKKLQAERNLRVDGIVGPITLAAITASV